MRFRGKKIGQMLDCQSLIRLALPVLAKGEDVAAQPPAKEDTGERE